MIISDDEKIVQMRDAFADVGAAAKTIQAANELMQEMLEAHRLLSKMGAPMKAKGKMLTLPERLVWLRGQP